MKNLLNIFFFSIGVTFITMSLISGALMIMHYGGQILAVWFNFILR